nr:retrotransposon Gag domain, retroviral aspartyl protease [Tanacetum cinerariifolium]
MVQTHNSKNINPPNPIATQLAAIATKLEAFGTMNEDIAALKEGERSRSRSRSSRNGKGESSWRVRQPQRPYNKIDFLIFSSRDPRGWLMKAEKYFRYYQIPDEEKVEIASMHLEGDALDLYSCHRCKTDTLKVLEAEEDMEEPPVTQFFNLDSDQEKTAEISLHAILAKPYPITMKVNELKITQEFHPFSLGGADLVLGIQCILKTRFAIRVLSNLMSSSGYDIWLSPRRPVAEQFPEFRLEDKAFYWEGISIRGSRSISPRRDYGRRGDSPYRSRSPCRRDRLSPDYGRAHGPVYDKYRGPSYDRSRIPAYEPYRRLRFEDHCVLTQKCCGLILRFSIEESCVLLKNNLAFCSIRILRFDQEESCVLLKKNLTFYSKNIAFCLNSQMHNNIMAAGSRDRPPMLAPGRYPQWRSQFLQYVDTRPNVHAVEATDNSPAVAKHTTLDTPANMSPENKAHFLAEKEAIHLILTGIGDDIYSTVDACQTAQEMWEAIERLQQGESLNIQDVKINLFWEFRKFTSHDEESMESYYTIFYKLINEMIRNNLTVTTMQVNVQFLQQLQPEWSRNANPLALVANAQVSQDLFYQSSRSHRSQAASLKSSISSRSHTSIRHKGKEIAKPITPPSETASEEDSDPKQAQKDKDMQNNLALIVKYFKKIYKPTNNNLRTSSNSKNKSVDTTPWEKVRSTVVQKSGIQCFNCKEYGHFAKECRKPKRVKDFAYHKEKMLQLNKLSKVFHCKQNSMIDSGTDSEPVEQVQNDTGYNVFANALQHSEQSESVSNICLVETDDSNVTPDSPDMCEDDIQNDQNGVESDDGCAAFANLIANLKLDVDENKSIQKKLKKANTTLAQELKEYKVILAKTSQSMGESISVRESCLVALQNKHNEFEKYKAFSDRTVDYDKLERKLNDALGQIAHKDIVINEGLKTKAYELSVVKEKHDELMKQSILTKSHYEGLVKQKTKVRECDCLAQKLSQQTESVKQVKNNTVCNEKSSNVFRKEREQYFEIQDLKAQMQDKNIAISQLKKLIEKSNEKYVDTKFDRPSVIRQPNAQRIPKPSVLGKPTPFSDSLERRYFPKTRSVPKTNVSQGLSKPVTAQTLPQAAKKAVSNTNVLRPGIPQLKSNQLRDKVLLNNSQLKVKKTQVEVHPRIPSVSSKMKSVTAYKDNLHSRTLNANIVQLILFIVDSECTKHMTGNQKLLCNFVEKFLGTVRFGNDQFAPILGYGDLVEGNDIVIGLPKLKYVKDQLCSSCELSKEKRSSFKSKYVPSSKGRLNLLHIDLCGPMRIASINEKKYILVIVDDYSRYTWTLFLRSKDETPEVLKDFLTMI